ncbi:MAG: pentapeptide repeat-containing protein, partial [Planctomycetaceae bacterium]|nr:pentapeptide repeat-containing protein [Planctomycetaceae bacterium]
MLRKNFILMVLFVYSVFLFILSDVYGADDYCYKCQTTSEYCNCEYLPSGPYTEAEDTEYQKKYRAAAVKQNKFDYFPEASNDNEKNLIDFQKFTGWHYGGNDTGHYVNNVSYFGTAFGKSRIENVRFKNCDFSYANFICADFSQSFIESDCQFYGAKINGANLKISQEQFLSTDPFIEQICRLVPANKKRISLEKLKLNNLIFDEIRSKQQSLRNVDFNKFNNGVRAKEPCTIRECSFLQISFKDCSFVGGELIKTNFISYFIENCDFSKANLKEVDFGLTSLTDSNFEEAKIECVNFAQRVHFHNPYTHEIKDSKLVERKSIANDEDNGVMLEKYRINFYITQGLQQEQLKSTSSYKNKKLIANKFCMNMK